MLTKKRYALIRRTRRKLSILALCVTLIGALCLGYKWSELNWYRSLIPVEVEIGDALLIEGESGLREGCGAAVFALTPGMLQRIKAYGLGAFGGPPGREQGAGDAHASRAWAETPYAETGDGMSQEDTWQVGLSCVETDPELARTIMQALRRPGSFVKKRHEAAVVVVPAAGIAALVYFG